MTVTYIATESVTLDLSDGPIWLLREDTVEFADPPLYALGGGLLSVDSDEGRAFVELLERERFHRPSLWRRVLAFLTRGGGSDRDHSR